MANDKKSMNSNTSRSFSGEANSSSDISSNAPHIRMDQLAAADKNLSEIDPAVKEKNISAESINSVVPEGEAAPQHLEEAFQHNNKKESVRHEDETNQNHTKKSTLLPLSLPAIHDLMSLAFTANLSLYANEEIDNLTKFNGAMGASHGSIFDLVAVMAVSVFQGALTFNERNTATASRNDNYPHHSMVSTKTNLLNNTLFNTTSSDGLNSTPNNSYVRNSGDTINTVGVKDSSSFIPSRENAVSLTANSKPHSADRIDIINPITTPPVKIIILPPVTINAAPIGANHTATLTEDGSYIFSINDFGFSDPKNSPSNNFAAVKMTTLPTSGTLTNHGIPVNAGDMITVADIASNQLIFTPAPNANGNNYSRFTFQVQDDGGTNNGGVNFDTTARTFIFNVTAVNDAPVNTVPNTQMINQDSTLIFNVNNSNLISVNDVDDSTNLQITLIANHGKLTLGSTTGLTFSVGDGNNDTTMTFNGSAANINAALAGLNLRLQLILMVMQVFN